MQTQTTTTADLDVLLDLNREYIRAVQTSDLKWFKDRLAGDFQCSLPDGTIIDRDAFLERAARPLDILDLEVHDVDVRLLDNAAIVHARTTFTTRDGRPGTGRYTDVWARREGRWLAVAAHFTRGVA
jgi:ketosteroid isomerase-like protein